MTFMAEGNMKVENISEKRRIKSETNEDELFIYISSRNNSGGIYIFL